MNIKDIIKNSALLLNKTNVTAYLSGQETDVQTLATVSAMTALSNLVINELACSYIPMVKKEEKSIVNGKINYTELSERVQRVLNVTDIDGNAVDYKSDAKSIYVKGNTVNIEYEFLPPEYAIDDEFMFSNLQVTERILSYALSAEECIREGRFDEAVSWHERYVQEIALICHPINCKLKTRRWV